MSVEVPMTATETSVSTAADPAHDHLLEISDLSVAVHTKHSQLPLLTDVSLAVSRGEIVGLVGESGSGKTMTSLSIVGALPPSVGITSGSVKVEGRELVGLSDRALSDVRGRRVGMMFQDARRSLDPCFTVGEQIAEVARKHLGLSRRQAWARAVEALGDVGIPDPESRARSHPHQFSGGMCQRVMIAMALVCEPPLLLADEPTTGLDVSVQARILGLLRKMQEGYGLGVLLVTHDLGVVAEMCDRVAVMYAGQIVEVAPVDQLFRSPQHPYTDALLKAVPKEQSNGEDFRGIAGVVPPPFLWPTGCRFNPRCEFQREGTCTSSPIPMQERQAGHGVRCARSAELELTGIEL